MAHTVEIKEIINGVQITETIDADVVVKLISYQSKPFLRTTNESAEETYQVLDIVGEIYNTPALATDFRIIDANDNVFIPANGVELIEYSKKIRAFRPDEDRDIFYIGNITTTSNSLTINLPSDDVNWAFIDGSFYEKYYPDTFNFTPVTTGQKILIVYAKPDSQVFYLAQGAESTEAVEPDYGGLFVARIIVDSGGQIVEEEELNFKERAEDAWRNITIAEDGVFILNMGNSLAASFSVNVLSGVATPTIGIIRQKAGKSFWDGSEFWIHNISNKDIILYPSDPTDTELWKEITFTETTIVKAESWAKLKIKYGELVVIEMGGGASVASEVENDSTVTGASVKDALETINGKTSSVVDKMLHYWDATAGKWLSSGDEFISAGILKVKSIILTTNSGTALPDELGYDGTNVFFGNTKRKLAFLNEVKTINGNVILDESYNGAICEITATCIITVPIGLSENFGCAFDSNGSVVATFVEGGITTFSAPKGKILTNDNTCSLVKIGANRFRLNGGLIPL